MRLIIRDDATAASTYVANYIVDRIKAFNPTAENPFVLGLPTGSSPLGVYKILVEKYKAGEVSNSSLGYRPLAGWQQHCRG
jgi:glucosamine-6-phosphate deaminase